MVGVTPALSKWGYKMKEEHFLRRIEITPRVMLGKAVIKGTRLVVDIIVEKLVIFLGRCFLYLRVYWVTRVC